MNELNTKNRDRLYMMIFMAISSSILIKLFVYGIIKLFTIVKAIEIIVN